LLCLAKLIYGFGLKKYKHFVFEKVVLQK